MQRDKVSAVEGRLQAKREEAEDFRERMMAKDYAQGNELKRLRQQVQESKTALTESQALIKHKVGLPPGPISKCLL